jgi:hypothetical protein
MIPKYYHEEVAYTVVVFFRVAALPGEAGAAAAAAAAAVAAAAVAAVAVAVLTTAVAKDRILDLHITIRI